MPRVFAVFILAIYTVISGSSPAFADKRVALIIANSDYQNARDLPNPRNDAGAIAKLLKTIDFADGDVTVKFDLSYDAMRVAIRDFGRAAEGADVALIYFAGHGLGSGVNYLVPIDAELKFERELPGEAISQRLLEDSVKGARGLKLVILDACRNDPSAGRMAGIGGATRNISDRGLGRVEPDGGVLVLYSAKHGTVAQDGPPGGNSPFAAALVKYLGEPGEDIRLVFGAVRDAVQELTGNAQQPFLYGSLGREKVYLNPSSKPADSIEISELQKRLQKLELELETQRLKALQQQAPNSAAQPDAPQAGNNSGAIPSPVQQSRNQSLWDHNGSLMVLVADGAQRSFVYESPRVGMRQRGVRRGTRLFEGRKSGNAYTGTAYVFSKDCGPLSYAVTGEVSEDQRQVVMRGFAPVSLDERCRPRSSREDVLIFTYASAPAKS